MKKTNAANRIDEKHSNAALITSTLALAVLTLITFVYNVYFHGTTTSIIAAYNFMLIMSLISFIAGAALIYVASKKDVYCFEYSLFFIILSICFFMMHGVPFPTIKQSIWITVAFVAAFWIASVVIHCFVLPAKYFSKKTVTIVLSAAAVLVLAAIIIYIIIGSRLPGFSLWM